MSELRVLHMGEAQATFLISRCRKQRGRPRGGLGNRVQIKNDKIGGLSY